MKKYTVIFNAGASTYIDVELDPDKYETEADLEGAAIDAAYGKLPSLCFKCAGWGEPGVDLGDWEFSELEISE